MEPRTILLVPETEPQTKNSITPIEAMHINRIGKWSELDDSLFLTLDPIGAVTWHDSSTPNVVVDFISGLTIFVGRISGTGVLVPREWDNADVVNGIRESFISMLNRLEFDYSKYDI